jgi:large subunit ribosomal protein L6
VVESEDGVLRVKPRQSGRDGWTMAGTVRALLKNMVVGVSEGFEKRLALVGVGYRAQVKGSNLALSLGYSHPIEVAIPGDLSVETPSPTEVVVKGAEKQRVGQLAAEIRALRPPEPYKGKGVRYADERVLRKEAKKK